MCIHGGSGWAGNIYLGVPCIYAAWVMTLAFQDMSLDRCFLFYLSASKVGREDKQLEYPGELTYFRCIKLLRTSSDCRSFIGVD